MTQDEKYMKEAIKQAKKAAAIEEVPIGCVIVCEDKIIARSYNKRNLKKNTLAHAEIIAMNKASKVIGDWRLEGCTMYVTLEPCPMCAGAIVQARIPRVVIGSMNPKAGCAGSVLNVLQTEGSLIIRWNWRRGYSVWNVQRCSVVFSGNCENSKKLEKSRRTSP